jgi:hypothetical protein
VMSVATATAAAALAGGRGRIRKMSGRPLHFSRTWCWIPPPLTVLLAGPRAAATDAPATAAKQPTAAGLFSTLSIVECLVDHRLGERVVTFQPTARTAQAHAVWPGAGQTFTTECGSKMEEIH